MFPVLCVELSGSNVQKALNGREAEYDYFAYGNGDEALRLYGSTSNIGEKFWQLFGITNNYEGIYGS